MRLNCFRAADPLPLAADLVESPRPSRSPPANGHHKRTVHLIRRHGSADSRSSSASSSNDSISRLPPCRRSADAKVEAMMMPVPPEPRPSRCLRLSQPKTYSAIIDSMKSEKGCRDWRSFAVFPNDDIDAHISAEDIARKRTADYRRKMRQFGSFSSVDSIDVDMIG